MAPATTKLTASATAILSLSLMPSLQPVARTRHRSDDRRSPELASQGQDRDAHGVAERVQSIVPDALHQLLGADDLAGIRHELLEHRELPVRELEDPIA